MVCFRFTPLKSKRKNPDGKQVFDFIHQILYRLPIQTYWERNRSIQLFMNPLERERERDKRGGEEEERRVHFASFKIEDDSCVVVDNWSACFGCTVPYFAFYIFIIMCGYALKKNAIFASCHVSQHGWFGPLSWPNLVKYFYMEINRPHLKYTFLWCHQRPPLPPPPEIFNTWKHQRYSLFKFSYTAPLRYRLMNSRPHLSQNVVTSVVAGFQALESCTRATFQFHPPSAFLGC